MRPRFGWSRSGNELRLAERSSCVSDARPVRSVGRSGTFGTGGTDESPAAVCCSLPLGAAAGSGEDAPELAESSVRTGPASCGGFDDSGPPGRSELPGRRSREPDVDRVREAPAPGVRVLLLADDDAGRRMVAVVAAVGCGAAGTPKLAFE